MKLRRTPAPAPLPLLFAALVGLFLGFSLSGLSHPESDQHLQMLEMCQQELKQNQHQLSSSLSSLTATPVPKTVNEARKNLATALVHAWDLDRDKELWSTPQGGVSVPRVMLNTFMLELSQQLGNSSAIGPACMDWSLDYMRGFPACTELYNYQYSELEPKFHPATKDVDIRKVGGNDGSLFGLVQGDIGEEMAHVPENLVNFAIMTQVFEHVPHFWNAMPNLNRIMAPGGVVAFSVPFCYQFHPYPGDFYRYSPMALIHMFESSGFAVCQIMSSGWRTVQMHALGLEMADIDSLGVHSDPKWEYFTKHRSEHSLMIGGADYALVAQKLRPGDSLDRGCTLERIHLTNEVLVDDLKAFAKDFWPQPMPNFPYGNTRSSA
jgi:hypothetical protein